jgi:enamine deaminase RidA (YjgF/YER057c/UK114 family)
VSDDHPEARLRELGLKVPQPPPAVGNYVGAVAVGDILFVSGHGPFRDGEPQFIGKLGREFDVAEGQEAARLVMLNMLASIKEELGDLQRVRRVVKLLCLVNSTPEFGDQPEVANGASDLLIAIFGEERGRHARAAIGVAALPFGIAVEIEGVFQVSSS